MKLLGDITLMIRQIQDTIDSDNVNDIQDVFTVEWPFSVSVSLQNLNIKTI